MNEVISIKFEVGANFVIALIQFGEEFFNDEIVCTATKSVKEIQTTSLNYRNGK